MLVANRYRLGPSIARGGMGEVFRATDEQLGRAVAVKLLLPTGDEHAGERFHREARAAARLSDPHVVSVYDFGPHGDGFFLVMELVEGGTVATELAQYGALPKDRAIRIVEQAAAGLAAAHREDVVHRDVKPGNLLLATDGTVKVADFGIAHLPADGANTLTATGQIIGSALYLAPERASGGPAGMPSDVYSLGCVLYQLVTGQPPFTGEHPAAILYQHVDAPAVLPSLERPELAGPFESVLIRMLAKDPADRPTAAEIAAGSLRAESPGDGGGVVPGVAPAIAPAGAAAGAAAVPVGEEGTSALEPVDAAPASRAGASRAEADRARNKALAAGVVAVLATAAAVLAVVLLNGNEPNLPPTTEIDPPAGATSSTPTRGATTTAPSTGASQPTASRTDPTTSAPPSQTTSSQPTTASTSPSPTSPRTTSPSSAPTTSSSRPTQTSSTPSTPTSAPSTTARPPSSTPPSQSPGTTTPATGTPATGAPSSPAAD